jgi:hypothetical protein
MPKFRVHVYAIFRCPVVVEAESVEAAAKRADELFDPSKGEYSETIDSYLVDSLDENSEVVGEGIDLNADYTRRFPEHKGILENDREAWEAGYRWAMEVDNETRYVTTLTEAQKLMETEFAGQVGVEIRQLSWFNVS